MINNDTEFFYIIIFTIRVIVCNLILPNPFACFGLAQHWLNPLFEPIIIATAYGFTRLCGYRRGMNAAIGALLYFVFYVMVVGLLYVLVPMVAKNQGL